jgi:choline dehydrogenase
MSATLLLSVVAAAVAVTADDASTVGATVTDQGVTKIYGDSFGRPGYNDTYDYIVSWPW